MKTIKYAGEYDISDLKLFTASGEVIRLDGLYQSLDIYENMFSNSLTGSIIFIDKIIASNYSDFVSSLTSKKILIEVWLLEEFS